MRRINIDFFCKHCGKNVRITQKSIIPDREFGCDCDEFLSFDGRCPNCLNLSKINGELIPNDIKLELLDEYSGIVDETRVLWRTEAEAKAIDEKLEACKENLQKKIILKETNEKEKGYQKRLYPHWKPNTQIIRDL